MPTLNLLLDYLFSVFAFMCGINLDRQAEQVDEAVCIRLIVDLILIERCDLRVIQAVTEEVTPASMMLPL